ncbi:uncharacterized protein LOC123559362 [Mercenaria mercenaria]|uniref:uncharacterized protein LOC123559362 n=1 Tax=Mercenaria mercenaria TaxID=6596 RepID=UPI00234EAC6F|nr:uncharacterized protein LOC123559362 [Mercenaria mercenaria]
MSVWTSHQARLADAISKAGRTVKLGGDARCDSTGHTAKYKQDTGLSSKEVKNSYWMELEGLKRCLRYMSDAGIRVSHLVTYRHVQVKKYMREEQPTITHWFDVWHVAKGYRPYQETSKIVASKHLLKDIGKLSPAEQTSSLEAFHKVVCQFAPKFVHYDHPQMEARLCIASLHFNENANRAQATKKDGSLQFSVSYPKGRDTGFAKEVKVEMTYDYVDELMAEVLFCRETAETHSVALERRLRDETSWPSAGDGSRSLFLSHSPPTQLSRDSAGLRMVGS